MSNKPSNVLVISSLVWWVVHTTAMWSAKLRMAEHTEYAPAASRPLIGSSGNSNFGGGSKEKFLLPPPPVPLRSFVTQLKELLSCDLDSVIRNRADLFVRYLLTIAMGFVMALSSFGSASLETPPTNVSARCSSRCC